MSKSHRDNYRARKKRGQAAFEKKAKRRKKKYGKCKQCGGKTRKHKLEHGLCKLCRKLMGVED